MTVHFWISESSRRPLVSDSSVYLKISPVGEVSGSRPGVSPGGRVTFWMRSLMRWRDQ